MRMEIILIKTIKADFSNPEEVLVEMSLVFAAIAFFSRF